MKKIITLLIVCCSNVSIAQTNIYNETRRSEINIRKGIVLSGSFKLKDGVIQVDLSEQTMECLKNSNYSVIISPIGTWSGLYVKEINEKGFVVKSESGDLNAKFFWTITAVPSITETHEDIKH